MANIEFKTLEQFMPYWCQKILPAVYDDSLSYYQLLGRILQKYNEVIEIVNKHSETLIDHENRITAAEAQIELNRQAIEALKAELAKLDAQVKQNTANIAALTERVNGHDEAIATLQDWINNYKTFLGSHQATIDSATHDMSLSIYNTMTTVPWSKWNDVALNGGDSFTIIEGAKAVGILSLTVLSAGKFGAFGAIIEHDDLHYFTATYTRQGTTANQGGTDNWKEVELLDITNIKQSLGGGEYDTISQKVLTQLINSKLNHDMGITGATAGQYINIATVDKDGKPLTYGFGTPGGGGSQVDIVQTTGQSTTSVMSQKATTDAIETVNSKSNNALRITNLICATVVYPTTAGGTNGKFVARDGTTIVRSNLLAYVFGSDGKNNILTVKKTGASSWDRITWFKASAGEGLYDFAWYETDGTNAKAGVDRLTVASNGQFAVSEISSTSFGQDAPGSLIAGEFRMNKGDLTLEEEEDASGSPSTGVNGGYFPDGFFDGATTSEQKIERLMQYAFPVFEGHRAGTTVPVKLRCMGYAYSGEQFNWYAPWFTTSRNAFLALISCSVYNVTTPYFTVRYKTLV